LSMTHIFDYKKRPFPQTIILFLGICGGMGSIALAFSSFGYKELFCNDDVTPKGQEGGCAAQAMFLYYFSLAGCLFWFCTVLDLYVKVINEDRHGQKYARLYYGFGWGVPLIGLIVVASNNKFGYTRGYAWCFIVEDDNFNWQIYGFYFIILITMASGLTMIILIIYKISIIQRRAGRSFIAAVRYYWRTVLFITLYFWSFLTLCSYRFILRANNQEYVNAYLNYVICLLSGDGTGSCTISSSPDLNLWNFHSFVAATTGLWVAIFFGVTQRYNYIFWQRYYYKITKQNNKLQQSRAASAARKASK